MYTYSYKQIFYLPLISYWRVKRWNIVLGKQRENGWSPLYFSHALWCTLDSVLLLFNLLFIDNYNQVLLYLCITLKELLCKH